MRGTLRERFHEKWIPHPRRGCWIWIASTINGYGCIGDGNGKVVRAHQISWRLHCGLIPPGLCVLHRCDNPLCVNPHHLFLGTKKDNSDDMIAKGRDRKVGQPGESNGMARLTAQAVAQIRASDERMTTLAKRFGVTYGHIWQIRRGCRWH